jgi:hypothetical protein
LPISGRWWLQFVLPKLPPEPVLGFVLPKTAPAVIRTIVSTRSYLSTAHGSCCNPPAGRHRQGPGMLSVSRLPQATVEGAAHHSRAGFGPCRGNRNLCDSWATPLSSAMQLVQFSSRQALTSEYPLSLSRSVRPLSASSHGARTMHAAQNWPYGY